jgi:hypothetical protein
MENSEPGIYLKNDCSTTFFTPCAAIVDIDPRVQMPAIQSINQGWNDASGNPQGGISAGIGFTIAWQRGPLTEGRNGAFILEVLEALRLHLQYYQNGKFCCTENVIAIGHLQAAINALNARTKRRAAEGKLGTHEA